VPKPRLRRSPRILWRCSRRASRGLVPALQWPRNRASWLAWTSPRI